MVVGVLVPWTSVCGGGGGASSRRSSRDQVDDGEDEDPHDVDEVPVQADDLDRLGPLGARLPRNDIMSSDISMTMPTLTWTPWKPVSV